ncbi:hypothetical protein D3C76_775990 [compost metagenome]
MPGRRARQPDALELQLFPPVVFLDLSGGHAPPFQMATDAERPDEATYPVLQLQDRAVIQMIVMIMGQKNNIDRRKLIQRVDGQLAIESFATAERRRGGPKHRIQQEPYSPKL